MDKLGYLTVNEQDAGGPRSLSSENPLQQETKREKAKTMMSESQTDILTDNIIVSVFLQTTLHRFAPFRFRPQLSHGKQPKSREDPSSSFDRYDCLSPRVVFKLRIGFDRIAPWISALCHEPSKVSIGVTRP